MNKLFLFTPIILLACSAREKINQKPFPVTDMAENAWANYEGRWKAEDGLVLLELSLKSGAFGIDPEYRLHQTYLQDNSGSGTGIQNYYTTYTDLKQKYKEAAKEKYQGIYLKAIAYSIQDTMKQEEKRSLVIKRILDFNEDPDLHK